MERYTRRHRDVLNCHVVGVDKDAMSESELRKLICALESGAKVVNLPTADGGIQLCVSVLSLGPHGVRGTILEEEERRERPGQTSSEASERGVELEVNISGDFHSLRAERLKTLYENNILRYQGSVLVLSHGRSTRGSIEEHPTSISGRSVRETERV